MSPPTYPSIYADLESIPTLGEGALVVTCAIWSSTDRDESPMAYFVPVKSVDDARLACMLLTHAHWAHITGIPGAAVSANLIVASVGGDGIFYWRTWEDEDGCSVNQRITKEIQP